MQESVLKQIVAEWLEESRFPERVPRETTFPDLHTLSNILAVVGPRRSGKTYFLYQLMEHLLEEPTCQRNDILFVDFEDYRLIGISPGDIDHLLVVYRQLAGKLPTFLFFDEVQHLPEWCRILRTLHNQRRYRIVVSGSNSDLLSAEISRELRGRYQDILMLPFSFFEYLRAKKIRFTEKSFYTTRRGDLLKGFDAYLEGGSFPEAILLQSAMEKRKLLQNYFQTIFYRDVIERYNIRAKHLLDALMESCLNMYGDLFSISKFEKRLKSNGIPGSKRSISNYIQYLEEAFFLITMEKFSYSPQKRIMNPKKIYLLDTGFSALATDFSENKGKILENAVAVELRRRQMEAFYYKNRRECDFLLKEGRRLTGAIQVCWELNDRNRDRELEGLHDAISTLKLKEGLLLTHHQEEKIDFKGRAFQVLPVWKWLLL
jgi:predicted AAA+ superfamily ATPase